MNTLKADKVKIHTDTVLNTRYHSMQDIASVGQNGIQFCVKSYIEAHNKVCITLQFVK